MTLTAFLLARIDEDKEDPWRGAEIAGADRVVGPDEHAALRADESAWEARVLAECEAKRRIVDAAHADYEDSLQSGDDTTGLAEEVLRALALPYSDHPDYDEAWRP